MDFQVLVDGRLCAIKLAFGSERDLRSISHWRIAPTAARQPAVHDTIEFARLASKRFRYYLRSIPTASSLAGFRRITHGDPSAEISVLLLATASWFERSPILGLAQCRRTYCHHLVLEFLAVHPAIVGRMAPRVSGVGTGLVYGLAELAGQLGVKLVWGEATAHSAPFYSHILQSRTIKDQFSIRGETLARCRKHFRERFAGRLD